MTITTIVRARTGIVRSAILTILMLESPTAAATATEFPIILSATISTPSAESSNTNTTRLHVAIIVSIPISLFVLIRVMNNAMLRRISATVAHGNAWTGNAHAIIRGWTSTMHHTRGGDRRVRWNSHVRRIWLHHMVLGRRVHWMHLRRSRVHTGTRRGRTSTPWGWHLTVVVARVSPGRDATVRYWLLHV
jgi:hypothetical protein